MTESNAVTTTERPDVFGDLPPAYRAALAFRKQEAMVAAELGRMNWGAKVDLPTRRAVAAWGRQHDVDPTTEIDVLGNRIYLNGRYFYRKMAAMIAAGEIEYAFADHIHEDERLAKMVADQDPWAIEEETRRMRERIRHNVPEKAVAAVVFRVKAKSMETEVVGVKWTGGGTQKNDPVGDAKPVETAETRSMRRAMLKLAKSATNSVAQEVVATVQSIEVVQPTVGDAIDRFEADPNNKPRGVAQLSAGDDPYLPDTSASVDEGDVAAETGDLFDGGAE